MWLSSHVYFNRVQDQIDAIRFMFQWLRLVKGDRTGGIQFLDCDRFNSCCLYYALAMGNRSQKPCQAKQQYDKCSKILNAFSLSVLK